MQVGLRRIALLGALISAIVGCRERASAPEPAPAVEPRCGPAVYGVPEVDALLDPVSPLSTSPLYVIEVSGLDGSGVLSAWNRRLAAAAAVSFERLPPPSRVVLQNDLWGLDQRLARYAVSSATVAQTRALLARLVRGLALEDPSPMAWPAERGVPKTRPDFVASLPERTSLMPSLQHERLYGMRRLFRVFVRGGRRALVSQLVALDRDARPYLTNIIGDVEALELDGDTVVRAHVWHLDRRGLRCGAPLEAVHEVEHIPAKGANGFLLRPPRPVPLDNLPCRECHISAQMMSVPELEHAPATRLSRLLSELEQAPELQRFRPPAPR